MRCTWFLCVVFLTGCTAGPGEAVAQSTTRVRIESSGGGGSNGWIGAAPAQTRVLLGDAGETYVGVWVDAPDDVPAKTERPPMAVSLVVDTSGSMSGAKIAHARMAAQSLLESLSDGDIVSIYGFSNGVSEYASPTRLGPGTRAMLTQQVQAMAAAGGTNMYDGLSVASSRLSQAPGTHPVRRIVLISDGHANVGPSDPVSLGNLASQATEWGAQVTAIGVGLDYDEGTLGALAVRSSGRLYHLEQPYQMAHILRQELDLLAHTIATDAFIEVVPAPGVRILEGETIGSRIERGKLHVPLGNLHAGQGREVLFKARVDTRRRGRRPLATARLVYRTPDGTRAPKTHSVPIRYEVTPDRQEVGQSMTPRVVAMVASHRAAEAQLRAAEQLNSGNAAGAVAELDDAVRTLEETARRAPASDRRRIMKRVQSLQQTRGRAAGASSPAEVRGAALDSYDAAYEAQGY